MFKKLLLVFCLVFTCSVFSYGASYYATSSTTTATVSSVPAFVEGISVWNVCGSSITVTIYDDTTIKTKVYAPSGERTIINFATDLGEHLICNTNLKIVSDHITTTGASITLIYKKR